MNPTTTAQKKTSFSQKQQILDLLSDGKPHSNRDIMSLFIPKYTCRISEIRQDGINLRVTRIDNSNFAYQWLMDAEQVDRAHSLMPENWIPRRLRGWWN